MATEMSNAIFDYDCFRSLQASALVEYMEPLLNNRAATVSATNLKQMAAELQNYDEYHLVYAIELGMQRMPVSFAPFAAFCLSHERQSVRLAAHRQLLWLAPSLVSDDLIDTCRRAIESAQKYGDVADIVERLCERQKEDKGIA